MFRSALVKLMIWYVLLAMILSLIFSIVIYQFASSELNEGLHNQYNLIQQKDHDNDFDDSISAKELNIQSKKLRNDLFLFNIAVLIGSTIISYVLARRTLKPIEESHQSQIKFTAEASHELRTPIAAMRADTESVLMLGQVDSKRLKKTLQANLKDLDRLENLSEHLLSISRYRSGQIAQKQTFKLRDSIREVVTQLSRVYAKKIIEVEVSDSNAEITGDRTAIEVLFSIVLDNAYKYSPAGDKIQVTINSLGKYMEVNIKDNGIGINPNEINHVFEHFYRSINSLDQSKVGGYGLGLPMAKDIVKLHRGKIYIKSNGRNGTTVKIELPIK